MGAAAYLLKSSDLVELKQKVGNPLKNQKEAKSKCSKTQFESHQTLPRRKKMSVPSKAYEFL